MKSTIWTLLIFSLGVGVFSCAPVEDPSVSGAHLNSWPNQILRELSDFPPELDPQESLQGDWIQAIDVRQGIIAEGTLPEYFFLRPWVETRRSLFTMGPGVKIEVLEMGEDNKLYAVARATRGFRGGGEVVSRAFLRIDPETWHIVFAAPLSTQTQAYGMALDVYSPEAYVLVQGRGNTEVLKMSTFDGAVLGRRVVDRLPLTVGRRGLAFDSDRKFLYVLYGGQEQTSDFMPIADSLTAGEADGGVLIIDARSLELVSKIQLGSGASPVAVAYDHLEAKACVLAHTENKSTIFIIHGAFHNVTDIARLPERASGSDPY